MLNTKYISIKMLQMTQKYEKRNCIKTVLKSGLGFLKVDTKSKANYNINTIKLILTQHVTV